MPTSVNCVGKGANLCRLGFRLSVGDFAERRTRSEQDHRDSLRAT